MTFSEYIKFLEDNGIYLLEYQKILLEKMIKEKHSFSMPISVSVRHCGFSIARILFEIYLGMLENKNNAKKKSCINCKHSYLDSNGNGLIKFSCKKLDDGDSCLYGKYKTT